MSEPRPTDLPRPADQIAARWRKIAIVMGIGLPAVSWLLFLMPAIVGYAGGGFRDKVHGADVQGFLEAAILTTLWAAVPLLVTAALARRALMNSPAALPSVIGAIAGGSLVEAVVFLVLPVIILVGQFRGTDTDPPGTAQGWAAMVAFSPAASALACAIGWLAGYMFRRTRHTPAADA